MQFLRETQRQRWSRAWEAQVREREHMLAHSALQLDCAERDAAAKAYSASVVGSTSRSVAWMANLETAGRAGDRYSSIAFASVEAQLQMSTSSLSKVIPTLLHLRLWAFSCVLSSCSAQVCPLWYASVCVDSDYPAARRNAHSPRHRTGMAFRKCVIAHAAFYARVA